MSQIDLKLGNASATISPTQGAKVLSWKVGDRELLWPGEERNEDFQNGGIPILFPFAGRVWHQEKLGFYEFDSQIYAMPMHGFAHRQNFSIAHRSDDSVALRLRANAQTLAIFPWDFEFEIQWRLKADALEWVMSAQNLGHSTKPELPMPIAWGLHPYFTAGESSRVESDAKKLHRVSAAGRAEIAEPLHPDISGSHILSDFRKLALQNEDHRIEISSDLPYAVIYSQKPEVYRCVEPWQALPDAIHDRQGLPGVPQAGRVTTRGKFTHY